MSQFIELRAAEVHIEVLRSVSCRCNERQVDIGRCRCGQLLLCLLRGFLDSLKGHVVLGQVDAFLLSEFIDHVAGNDIVKVVAAKEAVAVDCEDFDDAVTDFDDGNIECTAAQVINHDLLVALIVKAVSQGRSRRLVDNSLDFKACNLACVLCRLALRVIEVSRYGDHRFIDFFTQVALRIRSQLLQDHSRNFLRCIVLSAGGHFFARTHFSLDGGNGVLRVRYRLPLGRFADQSLAALCKCHYRRCRPDTFRVRNNGRLAAFHNGHAAVSRTKVNTDDFAHIYSPL